LLSFLNVVNAAWQVNSTPISSCFAKNGEAAWWDSATQQLLWVDMLAPQAALNVYSPDTNVNRRIPVPYLALTSVVPYLDNKDQVLATSDNAFVNITLSTGALATFQSVNVPEGMRFNDGKCDPAGRYWAGTCCDAGGFLMMLTATQKNGVITKTTQNKLPAEISNGIVWTDDHKTMYWTDSAIPQVFGFDYDVTTGAISNQQEILDITPSTPDGMAIDKKNWLWVAHYGEGRVCLYDPTQATLEQRSTIVGCVVTPGVSASTSVALGGRNGDQIFITTFTNTSERYSGYVHTASLTGSGVAPGAQMFKFQIPVV